MTAHSAVETFEGTAVCWRAGRRQRGQRAYHAGVAAEESVARNYARRGCTQEQKRWRGAQGEIDLIMRDGDTLVFVEVKQSKCFERAAESLSTRQMARICGAAEEYLARAPKGLLTEMRFDVALVNGLGEIRVIENAFGAF